MIKSDKRINHTFDDYVNLISDLQHIIKIILLELRTIVKEHKNILFLYSLARASVQIESILQLWQLKHYSDCLILYRTQVERLLTLYYLIDTNSIKDYEDWSFIQNFENRNKAKSDKEQNPFFNKEFWRESRKRIERYQRLKAEKVEWKRPDSATFEIIAKKYNVQFLFKYGYQYASGYVHPLSSDGKDEFGLVTGIKGKGTIEMDTTSIINNSVIVLILMLRFALNEMEFEWNEYIFKFLNGTEDFLKNGNLDYKAHLIIIENMILNDYKIYRIYGK